MTDPEQTPEPHTIDFHILPIGIVTVVCLGLIYGLSWLDPQSPFGAAWRFILALLTE